jgi:hypothetical protein
VENTVSSYNASKWQMGFNSVLKGLKAENSEQRLQNTFLSLNLQNYSIMLIILQHLPAVSTGGQDYGFPKER